MRRWIVPAAFVAAALLSGCASSDDWATYGRIVRGDNPCAGEGNGCDSCSSCAPACAPKPCAAPCAPRPCAAPCAPKPCAAPCAPRPCAAPCAPKPCAPPCQKPPPCARPCERPAAPPCAADARGCAPCAPCAQAERAWVPPTVRGGKMCMRWIPPVTRDVLHTDVAVCRRPIDRVLTLPAQTSTLVPDVCTRRAPVYDWACAPKTAYVPVVDTADRLCPVPTPCGRPTPRLTTVPVGTHLEQVPVGTQDVRVPVGEQDVTVEIGQREVDVPGVVRRMEHLGDEIHLADRGQVVEKRVVLPGRWVAEPTQVPVPGYWVTITCDPAQSDGRTVLTRAQYDALVGDRR